MITIGDMDHPTLLCNDCYSTNIYQIRLIFVSKAKFEWFQKDDALMKEKI